MGELQPQPSPMSPGEAQGPAPKSADANGAAVGGIAEMSDVAGTGDTLLRNHIIVAAVTAPVAFAAGGWYARRRWVT